MRSLLLVAAGLAIAGSASANPLDLARFGGLRADPVIDGGFALYWNPAALAQPGWDLAVDGTLIARQASYDRDAALNHVAASEIAANAGVGTISTVGAIPNLMGRYGRSFAHVDLGVGLGAFVDTGGAATWDKNLAAPSQYPGAVDGPQRWASIEASLVVADLGLGLAVRHRATGLSLGVTPMLEIARFSTTRARDIDGTDDLVDAQGNLKEGRAAFNGSGLGFAMVIGARWDIKPRWTVAATYQVGAQLALDGTLRVVFGTQAPSSQSAKLELPVADNLRVAAALGVTRWLTLRPMLQWSRWSMLDSHVFRSAVDGSALQVIPRKFDDGFGGKLRADAHVGRRWMATLGVGYEHGPTPTRTMDPGFGEGDSLEFGAAARLAATPRVDVSLTFLMQYYLPRTVTDSIQQPLTNGTYRDQREMVILDVEVHEWRGW